MDRVSISPPLSLICENSPSRWQRFNARRARGFSRLNSAAENKRKKERRGKREESERSKGIPFQKVGKIVRNVKMLRELEGMKRNESLYREEEEEVIFSSRARYATEMLRFQLLGDMTPPHGSHKPEGRNQFLAERKSTGGRVQRRGGREPVRRKNKKGGIERLVFSVTGLRSMQFSQGSIKEPGAISGWLNKAIVAQTLRRHIPNPSQKPARRDFTRGFNLPFSVETDPTETVKGGVAGLSATGSNGGRGG